MSNNEIQSDFGVVPPRRFNYRFHQLMRTGLPESCAHRLASTTSMQSFTKDSVLVSKGESIGHWNLIIDGFVMGSVETENSKSTPINIYNAGSWFGEHSLVNGKPTHIDYIALTDVQTFSISESEFLKAFDSFPRFTQYVAKLMAWRMQKTAETLTLMKLGSTSLRVVMGIAQFAEALKYKSDRPPTIGFGEGVEIPIKQDVIASLCGVSRSEFSVSAQKLKNSGWIKISYGTIEILNIAAWEKFAQNQRVRKINNIAPTIEDLLGDLAACSVENSLV